MAHRLADRVKETASTAGLGAFTLAGAAAGFQGFMGAHLLAANGDTTYYAAVNGSEWEIGLGTRTGATTLARTTVLSSSNAGALVNFTAAPTVFCTLPAAQASGIKGPVFSAKATALQAFPANTYTKVNLAGEDFDTHGAFDTATSRFQPTAAGYYQVSGQVTFNAQALVEASIYKNGTQYKAGGSANPAYAGVVTCVVYLNGTTDYVELWGYTGLAQNTNAQYVSGYTHLEGFLIPGAGATSAAGGDGPAFRAYRNGDQAGVASDGATATTVIYNAETFDTNGCYDPATGRFTPNIPGYYAVQWSALINNPGGTLAWGMANLWKNGAVHTEGSWNGAVAGTAWLRSVGSDVVYMNGTTDYLDVRTLASASSGNVIKGENAARSVFSASFART